MRSFGSYIFFLLLSGRVIGQTVDSMLCERVTSPDGIDVVHPRLSWRLDGGGAGGEGLRQVAWQVLVASSKEGLSRNAGDLWNSGKVSGGECALVPYAGVELVSRQVCFWKVRVWTNKGDSLWSEYDYWTMGLLNASDWKGKWIGEDRAFRGDSVSSFPRSSASYFRKRFFVPAGARHATLYIATLGHYEVRLDGRSVCEGALAPADGAKRVLYSTCYLGNLVGGRDREILVVLDNGNPKVLLQLEMEDSAGRKHMVVSDANWQFSREGFSWRQAQLVSAPAGVLRSQL